MFVYSQVVNVHILKHLDTGRVKGAFVEFATQEDLRGGLSMSGQVRAPTLDNHFCWVAGHADLAFSIAYEARWQAPLTGTARYQC